MYEYSATIVHVIDGDGCWVEAQLGFYMTVRMPLRILGVNAPEIVGPDRGNGLLAKAFLETILPVGCAVTIKTAKPKDKFGRWLGSITLSDGRDVGTILVESGHAKPFMV